MLETTIHSVAIQRDLPQTAPSRNVVEDKAPPRLFACEERGTLIGELEFSQD